MENRPKPEFQIVAEIAPTDRADLLRPVGVCHARPGSSEALVLEYAHTVLTKQEAFTVIHLLRELYSLTGDDDALQAAQNLLGYDPEQTQNLRESWAAWRNEETEDAYSDDEEEDSPTRYFPSENAPLSAALWDLAANSNEVSGSSYSRAVDCFKRTVLGTNDTLSVNHEYTQE